MSHLRGLPSTRRAPSAKVRQVATVGRARADKPANGLPFKPLNPKLIPVAERLADLLFADLLKNPEKWR